MSITIGEDGLRRHRRTSGGRCITKILCIGRDNTCMKYSSQNHLCRSCAGAPPRDYFVTKKDDKTHDPQSKKKYRISALYTPPNAGSERPARWVKSKVLYDLTKYPPEDPQKTQISTGLYCEDIPTMDQYCSDLLDQCINDCVKEVERDIKRLRQ